MKKSISIILAILMCFSCFSIISFAETTDSEHITTVPEGYIGVYDIEDLYCIRNDMSANYILMNDIDLTEATAEGGDWNYGGRGWNPIGSNDVYGETEFEGIFDGNGYQITGMTINITSVPSGTGTAHLGLFASVSGTIKNLTTEGSITTNMYGQMFYAGGISALCKGTIINCTNYVSINITCTGNTSSKTPTAGGIIGACSSSSAKIINCINAADIYTFYDYAYSSSQYAFSSGIAGYTSSNAIIENCINIGNITATGKYEYSSYNRANGIAAIAIAKNCYNIGDIYGRSTSCGIGYATKVTHSYNIGSVKGNSSNSFAISSEASTQCYYLENCGKSSKGATSLTDTQMKLQSMYSGWDFDTVWTMEGREDYPYPELRDVPLIFPDELNHEHEYSSEITTPATHLAEGVMTYTCSCGDTYTEVIEKTTEHTYNTIVTEPTCTDRGFTLYFCACNDFYVADYVEANGHSHTTEITTPATHLTEGLMTFTCTCGDTYTEAIAKTTEHTYNAVVTAPTCTEKGYTTYTCECGDTYVSDYIDANGHSHTATITTPATHLKEGVMTYTCDCGDTYTESIAKTTEHTFTEEIITESTCTAKGKKLFTCECGYSYSEEIAKTSHVNANGDYACDICGNNICSHMCHQSGFMGFIWKIIQFFWKIFRMNPICECGAYHY